MGLVGMQTSIGKVIFSIYCFFSVGKNWLKGILHLLNNAETLERRGDIHETPDDVVIFFEMKVGGVTGKEKAETKIGPRLIATHLPLIYFEQQMNKCPKLKVIQTIRNAKDTLVSYYHFYRMHEALGAFNGSWDDFFKLVENKELAFGDYFDHTAAWYVYNKQRQNSLILMYEDMKKDLKTNVKKIAGFLDKEISENVIDTITTRTTFENMKVDKILNPNEPLLTTGRSELMRKGTVGDWKGYFNEEQNHFIEQRYKETLQPLGLQLTFE